MDVEKEILKDIKKERNEINELI